MKLKVDSKIAAREHCLLLIASLLMGLGCCETSLAQSPVAAVTERGVIERPWLDANPELEHRVDALVHEMTLAEKVGQLTQLNGLGGEPTGGADNLVASSALYERIRQGELGSILNERNTAMINALQRVAVEESRLGVPLIFGRDVIHGYRTIFPIPLGQAASWNPELVEESAAVAARETRRCGNSLDFCTDGGHCPRSALGPYCRRLR